MTIEERPPCGGSWWCGGSARTDRATRDVRHVKTKTSDENLHARLDGVIHQQSYLELNIAVETKTTSH